MALLTNTVTVTALTSTGSQSITGVGFQPKLVILIRGSTGSSGNNLQFNHGAATGASEQWACSVFSDDNQATSDTSSWFQTGKIISLTWDNQDERVEADLTSLDSDGFTLNYTVVTAAYSFTAICIGGDIDAKAGTGTIPSTTGDFSITGVGFQPKAITIASTNGSSSSTASTTAEISLGHATDSAQCSSSMYSQDNATTTITRRIQSLSKILNVITSGSTLDVEGSHVSMDSDGFTLNLSNAPSTSRVLGFIAIGGNINVDLRNTTQLGSVATDSITGLGFAPSLAFGLGGAFSALDTIANTATINYGFSDGINSIVQTFRDINNQSTVSNNWLRAYNGIAVITDTSSNTINSQATYSNASDGYDINWNLTDGNTSRRTFMLAIGATGTTGKSNPLYGPLGGPFTGVLA